VSGESKMDTENLKLGETTNYVQSSQPGFDVDAPAIGVFFLERELCVIQDEDNIPANVYSIEGDKVSFKVQYISDGYTNELSECEEWYVGTIIKGTPPVADLEDKYSTAFYISVDDD
jgi:hypothetical protein